MIKFLIPKYDGKFTERASYRFRATIPLKGMRPEDGIIKSDKATKGYLKEFQQIEMDIDNCTNLEDWWKIFNKLIKWESDFEEQKEPSLVQILNDQLKSCNHKFVIINK